jgi:hypothetical protein
MRLAIFPYFLLEQIKSGHSLRIFPLKCKDGSHTWKRSLDLVLQVLDKKKEDTIPLKKYPTFNNYAHLVSRIQKEVTSMDTSWTVDRAMADFSSVLEGSWCQQIGLDFILQKLAKVITLKCLCRDDIHYCFLGTTEVNPGITS